MYGYRRKALSQNFLYSRKLVRKLIGNSSIAKKDFVLDLGAGRGILTDELSTRCNRISSIELDPDWYNYLINKYQGNKRIEVLHVDILKYRLPDTPYKVFSNIPFSIEGEILRKLLNYENPPEDSYLVLRKDFAKRIEGKDKVNLLSLQYKPWFTVSIQHFFNRFDFEPAARMDCVLLRIEKKQKADIPVHKKNYYFSFLRLGFGNGHLLWRNLATAYPKDVVLKIIQELSISKNARPGDLSYQKWIELFYKNNW